MANRTVWLDFWNTKGPIYNDHISEENCFQMISSPWSMVDININKSVFIIVLPVKNKKNG